MLLLLFIYVIHVPQQGTKIVLYTDPHSTKPVRMCVFDRARTHTHTHTHTYSYVRVRRRRSYLFVPHISLLTPELFLVPRMYVRTYESQKIFKGRIFKLQDIIKTNYTWTWTWRNSRSWENRSHLRDLSPWLSRLALFHGLCHYGWPLAYIHTHIRRVSK